MELYRFMDMELFDFSLEKYMADTQAESFGTPLIRDWDIVSDITSGLSFLFSRNMLHGDLKPSNGISLVPLVINVVLYSRNDGAWKLTHFGLTSEATANHLLSANSARGISNCRAPESSYPGNRNHMSDIWALGCIFHELIFAERLNSANVNPNLLVSFASNRFSHLLKSGSPLSIDGSPRHKANSSLPFISSKINDQEVKDSTAKYRSHGVCQKKLG